MKLKHFSSNTFNRQVENVVSVLSRGVGGTPLYKPYRYVPPHRVGFLRRFGLKTDIHFAHFGLDSGMVFEGTTECMNVSSFQFQMSKKEREICKVEMDLNNFLFAL